MKRKTDLLDVPRIGFEFLSLFDWITPLLSIVDVFKQPHAGLHSWTFFIPNTRAIHAGWSERHIRQLLKENGYRAYGHLVNFGQYQFCVPIEDAADIELLLKTHGIPIAPRSQGAPRK